MVMRRRVAKRPILNAKTQKLIPSEYQECKAFWDYILLLKLDKDFIKHANERMGDKSWFIKALFAIGFYKGLLDYQYIVSNEKFHGLWIEMKRVDQREEKKRIEQDKLIARLLKNGYYATYAYGCEDAIRILTLYINNRI